MGATPRLRLFAGPNGSGKSVLKSHLPQALLGVYLNPDEIEAAIRRDGFLDLNGMDLEVSTDEIRAFFSSSDFLIRAGLSQDTRELYWDMTEGLPPDAVGYTDGHHLDTPSAARVMDAIMEECGK
jgi:hypothetical protein